MIGLLYTRQMFPYNVEVLNGYPLKLEGPVVEGSVSYGDFLEKFEKFMHGLPYSLPLRMVVIKRLISLSELKGFRNWLQERQYQWFEAHELYRRDVFLLVEGKPQDVKLVKDGLEACGIRVELSFGEFYSALASLYGGDVGEPFSEPVEELEGGILKTGQRHGLIYYMTKAPERVFPSGLLRFNPSKEYLLVLGFEKLTSEEVQLEFGKRLRLFELQAREGKDLVKTEVMKELIEQSKDIGLGRNPLYAVSGFIKVFGAYRELLKEKKKMEFGMKMLELPFESEDTTNLEAFKLLFRFDRKYLQEFGLVRYIPQSSLSWLVAPVRQARGMKEGVVFINSVGEPFYLDIRVPPPNMLVIGQMGSGKSVFLQHFAMYQDYVIFVEKIMEGEGSYTVFTKMLSEEGYYPVALDRPLSINPFGKSIHTVDVIRLLEDLGYDYREFTEADLVLLENLFSDWEGSEVDLEGLLRRLEDIPSGAFLRKLINEGMRKKGIRRWKVEYDLDRDRLLFIKTLLSMAYKLGKGDEVDPSIIEEVVIEAYRQAGGQREVLMSDFVKVARELGYEDVAHRLRTYTMEGTYGHFFDRPSQLKFTPYCFFELRTSDRELLPLVLLSILTWMVKWYSRPELMDKTKGIILDEAWAILEDPSLVKFVEEAFRTYRKKGIFIAIASQFATDFASGTGEVVKRSCPYQVFLFSQNAEEVGALFDFIPEELALYKQVRPPRDYQYRFSLFYMRTPYERGTEKGLFMLLPCREFYWISTTKPEDRVKREEYKNRYGSLEEAIRALSRED